MNRPRVLCVDDEPRVLEGLSLHLRRAYDVTTATSGALGLDLIAKKEPFAVVLSDMRMPGMDGAEFLSQVRQSAPDTVRMLLTGYAEVQAAIAAVNEGQIFRFLTKPCPPGELLQAFAAAAEQYRLVTAERVLLEQTLRGSIKTLTEILSLTSPIAFGRANRVRRHVDEIADAIGLKERWQVDVAAMLSELGSIVIPEETLKKHTYGEELDPEERAMIGRMPAVTEELLANIPRLEPVRDILKHYAEPHRLQKHSPRAAILKIAVDFDELESRGFATQLALDTLRGRQDTYDLDILDAFARAKGQAAAKQEVREIPLVALGEGMILAEDIRTKTGLLVVTRGYQVTASFVEKARNYREGYIREPLRVIVRSEPR